MGIRIGNVPTSTLNDTDNILFAEGEAPRKVQYSEMKADIIGSATLLTNADKPKEAINELVQDLLDSCGYGVISGGVVSTQSTPNMTVQVSACTYKTSTGARKTATANSSLTVAAADTTNPRADIVYINSSGVISYLQGTAAASPVAPATPTGGFLLAQINVSANATSATNSNIVDMRKILISTDYLNTQLSDKVNKTSIVNNLSATVAGSVLDATQGKILGDKLAGIIATKVEKAATEASSVSILLVNYTVTKNCFALINGIVVTQASDTTIRTQNAFIDVNSVHKSQSQMHLTDTNRRTQAVNYASQLNAGDTIALVAYNDQGLSNTYYGALTNLNILIIPR
jgi:hypothetical protein